MRGDVIELSIKGENELIGESNLMRYHHQNALSEVISSNKHSSHMFNASFLRK